MNNAQSYKRPASPPQKHHTTAAIDQTSLYEAAAAAAEAVASPFAKWRRPALSQEYLSHSTNLLFQELEVDYVIGESHEELVPDSRGPAAIIRIFGVTKEGHSVCCNVHGFEPYFYVSCPPGMEPDGISRFHKILEGKMREANKNAHVPKFVRRVEMVLDKSIINRQELGPQPFLKIVVALPTMVAGCCGMLDKGIQVEGLDMKSFVTYEGSICFAMRFMFDCNIVGGNWIEVLAGRYKKTLKNISYCQLEFDCHFSDLVTHVPEGEFTKMAPFRILSFDIECPVRGTQFPQATHDPVIQVANILTLQGEAQPLIRNVMTLKSCSPIVGVDVMSFDTEKEVLLAWRDLIREVDPDIITGFNICRFDLPYLIERAEVLGIADFPVLGRVRNSRARLGNATFLSRRFGTMECREITVEGRVQIDLFQAIHRDYLLKSYKLNDIAAHFLGDKKEDVHFSRISHLQNGSAETRRQLAVYCLKDASLPQQLLDHLMYVSKHAEMARVTGVPISYLLSKGQSTKDTPQLLSKAKKLNQVIPTAELPRQGTSGRANA
ncbi:hypothetical protein DCAR_0101250 [Daucus carota subsp. sativus]|uniref:DNA polymerase delta catalytic subunit n=1 Tax=Daucus carota subsp. sativus TaxID=79200 RepID=A0A166G8H3_DAUCS|nr:PREDICTED: DNA polymerase delta catalytic subunit-like isoform X2 [Daucus carota subsp. sativus]WOG82089.1 hypothetical protein DCAR_0101250 [Daucus carota subsp. sativus]